jgi:alkanesulfonate monooxygenase SsuD/methylene tetrahydromethanopterin reductase-like flavin-dependent oxidoreductase (luciferase family)
MVRLVLRFDLRNPGFAGVSASDRIRSAIDMAEWADRHGGVAISVSEHHGSDDGYLPAPVVFAAAVAARTKGVRLSLGALVAPFYDPLRLAEDLAVLDNISEGRIDLTIGAGYLAEEFQMFGVPPAERARRTTEVVETLRKAWTGEPFEYRGHVVRVTPVPHSPGGPSISLGGSSEGAARRAARIADGFATSNASHWKAFREERVRLGRPDPGPPPSSSMTVTALADDPEAGWAELLPYFMHDMNSYGAWIEKSSLGGPSGPYRTCTPEELKESGLYRVVSPEAYIQELSGKGSTAVAFLHPMVGGIPPELAWASLRLFEENVLPALPA